MKRCAFFASAGAVILYIVMCIAFRPFVADDAFIVGRYALNAAAGHGLVYNVGEQVSALTSPLHALVMALIAMATSDPVAVYRWIGPALPLLAVWLAVRIYRPRGDELALFLVIGLASPFAALWAGGGLETPILMLWITLFAAILMRGLRRASLSNGDLLALGVLAALAFLTRFDSVLLTLPSLAAVACVSLRRPALWLAGLVSAAIALSWLVFAYGYYGDIFPTSVYTKAAGGTITAINGIGVVVNFLILSGALLAVPFALRFRAGSGALPPALVRAIRVGAVLSVALFGAYALRVSGVHMMFGYRMLVPVLPALAMILASLVPGGRARILALVQGGVQIAVAATVLLVGINVSAVQDFGPLGTWHAELHDWTPAAYGRFMSALEEDAHLLEAHWQGQGIDRAPSIYLFTGGMGYWLPSFYVFESLVSFRHDCHPGTRRALGASDYVQDLDSRASHVIRDIQRSDRTPSGIEAVGTSFVPLSEVWGWTILVRYAPRTDEIVLPKRLDAACEIAPHDVADEIALAK